MPVSLSIKKLESLASMAPTHVLLRPAGSIFSSIPLGNYEEEAGEEENASTERGRETESEVADK